MRIKGILSSNKTFGSLENWSLRRGGCLREAGVRLREVAAASERWWQPARGGGTEPARGGGSRRFYCS